MEPLLSIGELYTLANSFLILCVDPTQKPTTAPTLLQDLLDKIEAGATALLKLLPSSPYGDEDEEHVEDSDEHDFEVLGITSPHFDRHPLLFLQAWVEHRRADLMLLQSDSVTDSESESESDSEAEQTRPKKT